MNTYTQDRAGKYTKKQESFAISLSIEVVDRMRQAGFTPNTASQYAKRYDIGTLQDIIADLKRKNDFSIDGEAFSFKPAPVVVTAPVCGTCGGEGNCPDCMVWDAPLTEVLVDLHTDGMTDADTYASVEAAILADYPVQFAEAAPVCPTCDCGNWDCDYCKRDAMLWAKAEHTAAPITETVQTDIVTQLEARAADSAQDDDDPMPATDIILMLAAADEIRALQAVITDLQAHLHECERARTATSEAFAGHVEASTTEAEQLRGEVETLKAKAVSSEDFSVIVKEIAQDLVTTSLADTDKMSDLIRELWREVDSR